MGGFYWVLNAIKLANLLASSKSGRAKFTKYTSETIHIMQDY